MDTVRRNAQALGRNIRVLIQEFGLTLSLFLLILGIGTWAFAVRYPAPSAISDLRELEEAQLDPFEAFYATFTLIFFQTDLVEFDKAPPEVRILFFAIPAAGLAFVGNGILRFGKALLDRDKRKETWLMAVASTYRDHIVICGLGRIGYRVVNVLLRLGEDVIGIERNLESPFREEIRQMNVPVLLGDARQREILEQARVREASAIVVCTEDDLTNLAVALEARELNPGIKVVMRMFDSQLAEKVQHGFKIHTAFSTSALAAPVFAAAATRAQIDYSFYVDDDLMNVARATVHPGSALEGHTIAETERELDLSIILHKSLENTDLHPAPDVTLRAGDCLVVFASLKTLKHLHEVSGGPCETPEEEIAT
jgi:voltage-gated potassium channel